MENNAVAAATVDVFSSYRKSELIVNASTNPPSIKYKWHTKFVFECNVGRCERYAKLVSDIAYIKIINPHFLEVAMVSAGAIAVYIKKENNTDAAFVWVDKS